jgi:hypothetical protein
MPKGPQGQKRHADVIGNAVHVNAPSLILQTLARQPEVGMGVRNSRGDF